MTRHRAKPFESLTERDFREHPVWEFTNDDEEEETMMAPVSPLPVDHLRQRIVATEVVLANGERRFATLSNVDVNNPRATKHFVVLDVFKGDGVFQLPQYHDDSYATRGPAALAQFLGLSVEAVFPIRYDLRQVSRGAQDALVGVIEREPSERLGRAERISLSME